MLGSGDRSEVYLGYSGGGTAVALKVFRADASPEGIERDIAILTSAAAPRLVRLLDVAQYDVAQYNVAQHDAAFYDAAASGGGSPYDRERHDPYPRGRNQPDSSRYRGGDDHGKEQDFAAHDDMRTCLVLERLGGGSLARYLIEHPRLTPGEVVTMLAPITMALDSLHSAGFAHGGLSQATVLLDATGRPVVTGLGSARWLNDAPRERMLLLQADYARLTIILQGAVDAIDESDPHSLSGTGFIRQFQAAVSPKSLRLDANGGAPLRSVLAALEHELFDWADAAALRGFEPSVTTEEETSASAGRGRSVDSVRLRRSLAALNSQGAHGQSAHGQGANGQKALDPMLDEPRSSGDVKDDDGDDDVSLEVRTYWRSRHRELAGRLAARVRTPFRRLHPRALVNGLLDTALDAHPVQTFGHLLRKRTHGRRRQILIAGLSGASVLVVALTLLPLSGRDGGSDPASGTMQAGTPVPATDGGSDAAATTDIAARARGSTSADSAVSATESANLAAAIAGDDPVAAVVALLASRASCLAAASLVCLVSVDQTGSAVLALDSYDARQRQQGGSQAALPDYAGFVATLAERTGNLAVVALDPAPTTTEPTNAGPTDAGPTETAPMSTVARDEKRQPASVLVVKGEDGWRLREIFDY